MLPSPPLPPSQTTAPTLSSGLDVMTTLIAPIAESDGLVTTTFALPLALLLLQHLLQHHLFASAAKPTPTALTAELDSSANTTSALLLLLLPPQFALLAAAPTPIVRADTLMRLSASTPSAFPLLHLARLHPAVLHPLLAA